MKTQQDYDNNLHIKADECFSAGDNLNAIKHYSDYLKRNDNDYCRLNRGIAHYREKHYKRALKDLQKIVNENTKFDKYLSLVFLYLASVLLELKQYDEALKYSNIACKKNTSSSQVFYERAILYIRKKEYRKALLDLNKAIKINPTESLFFEARGNVLLKHLKNKTKGLKDLQIAEELRY